MRKTLSRNLITVFAFYISIAGLVFTLLPLIAGGLHYYRNDFYNVISLLIPNVELNFLNSHQMVNINDRTSVSINVFCLVFYLLFLLSAVIFLFRGFKESRVLAFCFSLIFLGVIINDLVRLGYSIDNWSKADSKAILFFVLNFLSDAAWAILAFFVLKSLQKQTTLQVNIYRTDDVITEGYYPASNWQRFAHLLIDRVICVLVFSPMVFYFAYFHRESFDENNKFTLYACLLVAIFIFYLLLEGLLGTTPGKLLTATRVTTDFGDKPPFKTIMLRTLSRLVPFEAFSFLGSRGWHDGWTDTYVLQEKPTGWNRSWYFLLLPLLALIAYGSTEGLDAYGEHRRYTSLKNDYDEKMESINKNWKEAGNFHLLKLKQLDEYSSQPMQLRVVSVSKDSIVFTKPSISQKNYSSNYNSFEGTNDSTNAEQITLHRSTINNLLSLSYDDYEERKGVALFEGGPTYAIEDMYNLSAPELRNDQRMGGFSDFEKHSAFYLLFKNYGSWAQVVEIKPLEGNAKWSAAKTVDAGTFEQPSSFSVGASEYEFGESYKVSLLLKDNKGRLHKYIIEGDGINSKLKEEY